MGVKIVSHASANIFQAAKGCTRTQLHKDPAARAKLDGMMEERFDIYHFSVPMPKNLRVADWPNCAQCAAQFYLHGPPAPKQWDAPAIASADTAASTAPAGPSSVASSLAKLAELKAGGFLTDAEFTSAKQRILT